MRRNPVMSSTTPAHVLAPDAASSVGGSVRRQSRRSLAVLAVLGAGLALGACGSESVDLAGKSFTSTQVRGHDLVEGSTITLTFEDGRVSAQGGCNTLNGAATWEGDTLEVAEPMASTMMACDQPLMDQDQWLSTFLTSSPALEVDGETLTLGDDTTGITLAEN